MKGEGGWRCLGFLGDRRKINERRACVGEAILRFEKEGRE